VENHAANELDVEMAHVEETAACFADEREGGDDRGIKGFSQEFFVGGLAGISVFELFLDFRFEGGEAQLQIFVGEGAHFGFARVDGGDAGLQFFDVALVLGADETSDDGVNCLGNIHEGFAVSVNLNATGRSVVAGANILF
jgi:hypothetical protein